MSQVQGYRDLGIYDAPGVALSQLAGGNFSLGDKVQAFTGPNSLSPDARKTMAERMLGEGSGPLALAVNLATNPFVLAMMFTFAPVGRALAKGRDPFLPAKGRGALHTPHDTLGALGTLGLSARTVGAHAGTTVGDVHDQLKSMADGITERTGTKLAKLMQKLGLETLDFKEAARKHGPQGVKKLEDLHRALMVRLNQMEKTYAPSIVNMEMDLAVAAKGAEEGTWVRTVLGSSTDPAAVKAFQAAKQKRADWQFEMSEAVKKLAQARDGGADVPTLKMLGQQVDELDAAAPPLQYFTPRTVVKEGDELLRWAPDGKENTLSEMADRIEETMPPEYFDYLGTMKQEIELRKRGNFGLDEMGQMSDTKAARHLRSYQQRQIKGDADILGHMDSGFGSYGADEGLNVLFTGEDHLNAIKVGATTGEEGLAVAKQMMMGGPAMASHYVPFNSVKQVQSQWMKDNRNLKAIDTSLLKTFDQDGMQAGMTAAKGLVLSKKGKTLSVSPDVYRLLADSEHMHPATARWMREQADEVDEMADYMMKNHQKAMPALDMNPFKQWNRYVQDSAIQEVMLADPSTAVKAAQAASVRHGRLTKGWEQPFQDPILAPLDGVTPTARLDDELWQSTSGLVTNEAMLRNGILQLPDKNTQKEVRHAFASMVSRKPPEERGLMAAAYQMKSAAASFQKTQLGQWLSNNFAPIKKALDKAADPDESPADLSGVGSGLARVFYMSHLGLNMGSMMINLMQPAIMALPQLGVKNTLVGYKRAITDMWKYSQARTAKYGMGLITPKQRQDLLDEILPHAREWGIGGDHLNTLDAVTFGSNLARKRGWMEKTEEVFLKGFEKTEWLNRMVTGYAFEAAVQGGGHKMSDALRAAQKRYIATTQFTNSPENTPQIFLHGPLSHPLVRQFLSFPLRTFTGIVHTSPLMGGQETYGGGLVNTVIRGMGTSAIMYEVAKQVAGVDISKGLFAGSATDIVGGDKYLESGQGWLRLPPILSVPHDLIAGLAGDDAALLSGAVARTIPGGVALNRVLGVMPEMGTPILDTMQKTSADWGNPLEDGRVPVYKGGRLVDYKAPSELVMRGLGVDMGRFNEPGSLDGYLVKQREEILKARHEYLRSLTANDHAGASQVAKAFEQKFGVPLTVSQAQVKAFTQSRNVPRTERILDRMPSDVRAAYAGVVASSRGLNVPVGSLGAGGTSTSRAGQREASGEVDLERRVRAAMEQQIKGSQRESMEFGSFGV